MRLVDVLAAQSCITRRGKGATLRYIHTSQLVNTGTPLPVIVEFVRGCGPGGVLAGSLAPSFLTATGKVLQLIDETGQAVKLAGMLAIADRGAEATRFGFCDNSVPVERRRRDLT